MNRCVKCGHEPSINDFPVIVYGDANGFIMQPLCKICGCGKTTCFVVTNCTKLMLSSIVSSIPKSAEETINKFIDEWNNINPKNEIVELKSLIKELTNKLNLIEQQTSTIGLRLSVETIDELAVNYLNCIRKIGGPEISAF